MYKEQFILVMSLNCNLAILQAGLKAEVLGRWKLDEHGCSQVLKPVQIVFFDSNCIFKINEDLLKVAIKFTTDGLKPYIGVPELQKKDDSSGTSQNAIRVETKIFKCCWKANQLMIK